MKLLTEAIKEQLRKHPLYSGEKNANPEILVKFFTPWSNWTWFVLEGEEQANGDWMFFGMVHGFEKELGYFMLSELQEIKGPMGLTIERDLYYGTHYLNEIK